jgi:hypothetical protein
MRCKQNLVHFGTAKKPKPTYANPKGTLKIAKCATSNTYVYSWMDSAGVYFIDPMTGPGRVKTIYRKNAQGIPVPYQVPEFIGLYNDYMHGVDVFDQVRKMFGCDLTHATKKYTVRVFEILFSMILAQAYNIHRAVHKNNPYALLTHTDFKMSLIRGLLQHHIVRPPQQQAPTVTHALAQHAQGTNSDGTQRRKVGECRGCSGVHPDGRRYNRGTTWFCIQCNGAFFHPDCFTRYHAIYPVTPPVQRVRRRANDDATEHV